MNRIGIDKGENRTDAIQLDMPQWPCLRACLAQPELQERVLTLSCMPVAAQNSPLQETSF